ncbi:hypothetical protein VB620_13780 [Nodularia harveyana UHCC-0300]|uniref:SPOR domain-containing protein n=1 Tax=Nodularia harveyana UHCC-0300 TaxID=2974287 RepID=A0ABU5UIY7_9CYAN|nr:hypothetical protein [Nodularia harveyana]MEA5582406.1 hypothetical protein [Nodularia harveyana UHCC-0300]
MNKYLIIGIIVTILGEVLIGKSWAQTPNCIANGSSEVTKRANSFGQGNVIVIGRVVSHPYVVVIPQRSNTALETVKKYISDAFLAQHRLGPYIHAGGFAQRSEAECVSHFLRNQGLDARVVYFR